MGAGPAEAIVFCSGLYFSTQYLPGSIRSVQQFHGEIAFWWVLFKYGNYHWFWEEEGCNDWCLIYIRFSFCVEMVQFVHY